MRLSLSRFGTFGRWHHQHLLHLRPPPWQSGLNYGFLSDWWAKWRSWMWLLWAGSGVGMYNMCSKVVWSRQWQPFLSAKVQNFNMYSSHCFTVVYHLFSLKWGGSKVGFMSVIWPGGWKVVNFSTSFSTGQGSRPHILDIEQKMETFVFHPHPYLRFFSLFLAWYGCHVTQRHLTGNVVGKTFGINATSHQTTHKYFPSLQCN